MQWHPSAGRINGAEMPTAVRAAEGSGSLSVAKAAAAISSITAAGTISRPLTCLVDTDKDSDPPYSSKLPESIPLYLVLIKVHPLALNTRVLGCLLDRNGSLTK